MIASIYKISDKDGLVYYGSTIRPIHQRLWDHKKLYNDTMTKTMHKESMVIEAVEQYYFDEDTYNKIFIAKRERSYIDNNPCINKQRPGRTMKEWVKKNKETVREKDRIKYQKNKESIKEKGKEKVGCRICKCMVRRNDFVRHTKTKKHQSNLSFGGSTLTKS